MAYIEIHQPYRTISGTGSGIDINVTFDVSAGGVSVATVAAAIKAVISGISGVTTVTALVKDLSETPF